MSFWGITNSMQVHLKEDQEAICGMPAVWPHFQAFLPHSHMLGQFGRYSAILWVWEVRGIRIKKKKKKINHPLMEPTSELQMPVWRII